jgi:hypothetical protein
VNKTFSGACTDLATLLAPFFGGCLITSCTEVIRLRRLESTAVDNDSLAGADTRLHQIQVASGLPTRPTGKRAPMSVNVASRFIQGLGQPTPQHLSSAAADETQCRELSP